MGHLFFYVSIVAACLLWSAAFTAAAARTRPGWIRWLLIVAALAAPVASLLPWVVVTAMLAFQAQLATNWFAPTLTAMISAAVGGAWIVKAGLSPRSAPVAAEWRLVGLAAMFVLAKAVAAGTLLFIDNAVRAEARAARAEAVAVMQTVVPPIVPADDDAAPLLRQAFALLEADEQLNDEQSPLADVNGTEISSVAVTDLLARHQVTLDLLRRAAGRPGCRFPRDWTRPSFDMLLPETQAMREAARLLALAARWEAAEGDSMAAVADIVRVHRLANHVAAEPILVSGLVAMAIDALALDTLMGILPQMTAADAAALDATVEGTDLGDVVRSTPSFQQAFLGEEALGLSFFAGIVDSDQRVIDVVDEAILPAGERAAIQTEPVALLFRCFFVPSELAAYRGFMKKCHQRAQLAAMPGAAWSTIIRMASEVDRQTRDSREDAGIITKLLIPALTAVLEAQGRATARHQAAEVLLAATRARLASGEMPPSAESLVPDFLLAVPRDPYLDQGPLTVRTGDDGWLVYSVGPDGEDDGGPPPAAAEPVDGNDDIGLRLAP